MGSKPLSMCPSSDPAAPSAGRASRRLLAAVAGFGLAGGVLSSSASAGDARMPTPSDLSLSGSAAAPVQAVQPGGMREKAFYLADGTPPAEEKPNVHGFFESPFKTSYVTPRGLVVENAGVVWQPVGGLVFPIGDFDPVKNVTFVGGIWNSVNSAQGDTNVGPWNEMDVFASLSGTVGKFTGTLTYGAWNFPQSTVFKPSTEHNIDFKLAFDDTALFGDGWFSLHPYVDFFYAVSGSSTVVLGKTGSTYYFEVGIVPTYTYKEIADYPLTLSFPIYFSVGPEGYWGRGGIVNGIDASPDGNFGVFSAAVNLQVPLTKLIPSRYGYWHADAGFTYYYLLNDTLLRAGDVGTGAGNDNHNVLQGSVGIGVNF